MKSFKYITLQQLLASVKADLPSFKDSGFIDEGNVVKTVMWCNEKLGMPIRKVRETVINIRNYQADLPTNFQKAIYVSALSSSSFGTAQYKDPFNNSHNQTDECEFKVEEFTSNGTTEFIKTIRTKNGEGIWYNYTNWTELSLSPSSYMYTDSSCINNTMKGKYTIDIDGEKISTPFREGQLYLMYYANLEDEDGNILIPFHPLITNWYEWCVKEKILMDMAFNSDGNVADKLKLAQMEKTKSWLDALDFEMEPEYHQLKNMQKKNEMQMWEKYFKWVK